MIKKEIVLFVIFVLINWSLNAQNEVEKGFQLLDAGNYQEAYAIFQPLLEENPERIDIQIGYGRALGLKGDGKSASKFFYNSYNKNKDNLELRLNYAESLLWISDSKNAKIEYQEILINNPGNWTSYIGLGNAYSIEKDYENALINLKKAKSIKNDLEYIDFLILENLLAKAYYHKLNGEYEDAISIYNNLLLENSKNHRARIGLGDIYLNQKEYDLAYQQFDTLQNTESHKIDALIKIAFIQNLKNKPKSALEYIKEAKQLIENDPQSPYHFEVDKMMLFALLWNENIKEAEILLEEMKYKYRKRLELLVPQAQIFVYKGQFEKAYTTFDEIIRLDSTSFDGNLGYANTLYGVWDYKNAENYLNTTLKYYPFQTDALFLKNKIQKEKSVKLHSGYSILKDNGNNTQLQFDLGIKVPLSLRWSIIGEYSNYQVDNSFFENEADINYTEVGIQYYQKNWHNTVQIGLASSKYNKIIPNRWLLFDMVSQYKINGNHQFNFIAHKKVYDYTADLINKEILFTNLGIEYSGKIGQNTGIFSQYMTTFFSDRNRRNSFLNSIYYSFYKRPLLKIGLNTQYITFKQQMAQDYYSPDNLLILEAFIEFNSLVMDNKKWGVKLELVPGLIKEKEMPAQFNYRLAAELGYRPSDYFHIKAFFDNGNNVSAQPDVIGYSMWKAGLKAQYWIKKSDKKEIEVIDFFNDIE